jgi:hypothetical protein
MKTVTYLSIGFGWLPILALAAWWAGFMPFPTRPAELGLHSFDTNGAVTADGKYSVGQGAPSLISPAKAREEVKALHFGLGQWDCDKENKMYCNLYQVREEPFYGWFTPRWVFAIEGGIDSGTTPLALYGTYAACKWNEDRKQKTADDSRLNYERWATEHNQKIEQREYQYYTCKRMPT